MAEEETELEPSGYVTSDGKDLDERYLKLENKTTVDDILDTVVQGIGVVQQDEIVGTSNPYTMPKDGYITWYGKFSHEAPLDYEDIYNWIHFWLNDVEVYSKQSVKGDHDTKPPYDRVKPNVNHTLVRLCKRGDILKVTQTGGSQGTTSQKITIVPYAVYRYDRVEDVLPEE